MQSGPEPGWGKWGRARVCVLLVGAAVVSAPGAFAAATDEEPPAPVTTTPAPEPTPDPAPSVAPKPAPKPAPTSSQWNQAPKVTASHSRPARAPAPARRPAAAPVRTPAPVYHAPAVPRRSPVAVKRRYVPPTAITEPVARPKTKVLRGTHVRAKPKARPAAHRVTKRTTLPKTLVPKPQPRSAVRVSLPLPTPAPSNSGGPIGLTSFLIVLGLVGAIACFALALVPATYMRWRPAVIFASERHLDLTVAGLALLMIAACMLVLGRGV